MDEEEKSFVERQFQGDMQPVNQDSVALREKADTNVISAEYAKQVKSKDLELAQAEALSQLDQYRGNYDETSIVLDNTNKERATEIAKHLNAKLRITKDGKYAQLTLPDDKKIKDIYADKEYLSYISDMSPDWIARPAEVDETTTDGKEDEGLGEKSSDLTKESTSQFNDPLYNKQTFYNFMNMGDTLSEKPEKKVKIAIIDSGIDIDHPEFEGIISNKSYNASTDQVVADYGMDVVQDCMGHGTVCAGMIAAHSNNKEGIVGITNNVELIVIKCETNPDKTFKRSSDINFGLAYAIEQNVDVVSMSIGGEGLSNPYATYCQLAVDSDITVVASAGNDSTATNCWPAADPNVIGVGALEENEWKISWYSNYGDNSDIMAPGRVLTTQDGGGYTMVHGTSLATPLTAGAITRFYATHSDVTYNMVKQLLEASAIDLGDPGEDWIYGYGALDVDTFLHGEIGKITFDYMTEDIKNTTQLFYRNHILQNFPEPEREGMVFAGWYLDEQCTEPFDNLTTPLTEDITMYAAWENEDEGVPFQYRAVDGGVEITAYRGKRKYVSVPNEIDSKKVVGIGSQAFTNNTKLMRVDLPKSLTYIGYLAFSGCNRLTQVNIPDAVTHIDNGAFDNCSLLRTVTITEQTSLTSIGEEAFNKCASLQSFYLGKNVSSVGGDAFEYATGMKKIILHPDNANYVIKDNMLYTSDYATVVYRPAAAEGETVEIDSRAQYIGKFTFTASMATKVIIPEGVLNIGKSAFEASRILSMSLPSTVNDMGVGCFSLCNYLSEFDFGKSQIRIIPDKAFKSDSMLTKISIPESVEGIGSDKAGEVFYGCGLTEVTWADNCKVKEIKPRGFYCTPLEKITIPASVEEIGMQTFQFCWNLSDVQFAKDSKLKGINTMLFWCCYSLKNIELPDSVEALYHSCFAYSGLESIHIPKNLSKIEEEVFQDCTSFAEITAAEDSKYYVAEDNVLYNKGKTILVLYPCARQGDEFTVPTGITGIAQYAFYGATQLSVVTLPETITTLGGYAFSHCRSMKIINLPSELVTIGINAFEYCTSLEAFDLPAKVKTIGRYAFYCCTNMESIRVPQDGVLVRIGYAAFAYTAFAYTGIKTFSMPSTVTGMGQLVFSGCSNLQTVRFAKDSKLTSISAWMFDGADALKRIEFSEGSALQYVSARAFERLKALQTVDLSQCKSLESIGNYALSACTKFTTVETHMIHQLGKIYKISEETDDENTVERVFKSLITAGTVGTIAKTSLSAIKSLPGINLVASALNAVMAATVVEMLGQMTILLFENIKSGKISLDKYNEVENFIKDYVKDNVPAIVETIEKMVSKNGDKINPKDVVKKLSKH